MSIKSLVLMGITGAAVVAASFTIIGGMASATVPGTNALVSASLAGNSSILNGTSGNGGTLSANGKFSGFMSAGYDVVASDTNNKSDVFIRNLSTDVTIRASTSTNGTESDADSKLSAVSETGRYVLFTSTASNLVDGQTITTPWYIEQLYVRDTIANTTTLLSKNASGVIANNTIVGNSISSDGRFVLFETRATNLGPTVTNSPSDNLYMLDRSDNSFTILNYATDTSLPSTNGYYPKGRMSCDGSLVVFLSAPDLTGTFSPHADVYLLDRRAGNKLTNLTISANDAVATHSNNAMAPPSISCNGNYVSFTSFATNLDPNSTPSQYLNHAYVYDRINDSFTLVDKSTSGAIGDTSIACTAQLSCISVSDAGIAAFSSSSTNLVSGSPSGSQIYVHAIDGGTTELLSRSSGGSPGNNSSSDPTISTDGSIVGYGSYSTNLVSLSDTNNWADAFTSLTGH